MQGLAFLGVLLLLGGLAVAQYAGAFRSGVPVTLKVDRVGTQLDPKADVKVRGLIVGRVTAVHTDGDGATVSLSLDPKLVDQIPADVTARLLPKTLFGQKFVSLVPPAVPSPRRIAAGAVIGEDRSRSAEEVEQVLDDLLPLLQAVRPQDLATTLGSLSQALQGRGTGAGADARAPEHAGRGREPGAAGRQGGHHAGRRLLRAPLGLRPRPARRAGRPHRDRAGRSSTSAAGSTPCSPR